MNQKYNNRRDDDKRHSQGRKPKPDRARNDRRGNREDSRSDFRRRRGRSDDSDESFETRRSQRRGGSRFNSRTQQGNQDSYSPSRRPHAKKSGDSELIRLNKYIAMAGICSRREADNLIQAGAVTVNGVVMSELGYKVKPTDVVAYGGETLKGEVKRYVLLNKPKGFITTMDDPRQRDTVMQLVANACKERIYPVGRLDRNTTGLLLFTNDGELARKLTHPSTGVYKIYHVELDKAVTAADMRKMREGIELEDGLIAVDEIQYVEPGDDKRIVGVALHSGRNRIVRRIFESLGYDVHKLDRVVFAGLTKKDLPRGRWRHLTDKEVGFLKMI